MAPAQVILFLLRFGLAAVFIYAGALKIWNPQQFALDVHHFQLTSWMVSAHVAIYLPWLEVFSGFALIWGRLKLGASLALAGMTVVFMIAITSAWMRGLDISCGCFGKEEAKIATDFSQLMLRDAALLAAAIALLIAESRRPEVRHDFPGKKWS